MTKWGAPGASRGASVLDAGDVKHQGAENSALKNNAPFSLTPLRMSENASIRPSERPAKFPGRTAKRSAQASFRAIHRNDRAWLWPQVLSTIINEGRRDVKRVKPRNEREKRYDHTHSRPN